MSGRLTTHVLNSGTGLPASGLHFTLFRFGGNFSGDRVVIANGVTDEHGRSPDAILAGEAFCPGAYCLEFDVEAYFKTTQLEAIEPYLGLVPINFRVTDPDRHYHVPLILSPFGYTTYRGS